MNDHMNNLKNQLIITKKVWMNSFTELKMMKPLPKNMGN